MGLGWGGCGSVEFTDWCIVDLVIKATGGLKSGSYLRGGVTGSTPEMLGKDLHRKNNAPKYLAA